MADDHPQIDPNRKVLLIDDTKMLATATRIDKTYAGGIRSLVQDGVWDLLMLDHDLGTLADGSLSPTGYDLLCFLEANMAEHPEWLPKQIQLITNNPVGRIRMRQVLAKLYPAEAELLAADRDGLYQSEIG